jgi:stearoyl-CoA desaturase (delta-9 desaturase)
MILDPDNWLKNDVSKKIKLNFILSHLLILYWIFTDFSILMLCVGILFYILIGKVAADIGFHRYFTHKSFTANKWVRKYLLINSTLIGHGSIMLWVVTHRIHHVNVDTDKDPHSPVYYGLLKTWIRSWTPQNKPNMILVKDLYKDKDVVFLHKHYWKVFYIWIGLLTLLSLIFNSVYPLLLLFAFPNSLVFHEAGAVNAICHLHGYQSYKTKDNSKNNIFVNFFTFGNGMHNTHHANPRIYTTDVHNKWYEFDPMKYIIRLLSYDGTRVEHKV